MISNDDRSGLHRTADRLPAQETGFAAFDRHSVAVILTRSGGKPKLVLRGQAVYVRDDHLGNALRIELVDDPVGQPVLLLAESTWQGRIIPDFHYGCDFCLVVE
jgi:hypothetical protein